MQTINHKNSTSLKEKNTILHFGIGKKIIRSNCDIGKLHTLSTLHIGGFIVLLFIFSIQIHIPPNPIQKSSYPIEDVTQQSIIQPYYNNSIIGSISEFGYELKGNSYSYPLPFFE